MIVYGVLLLCGALVLAGWFWRRRMLDRIRQLQTAEQHYRALFDKARDAIVLIEGGRFVDVNPAAVTLFGRPSTELIGKHPAELSPERQPDGRLSTTAAEALIQSALRGETTTFPWRHERPEGTALDVEVSLNRVVVDGRHMLHAILRDVTVRRHAEEALQQTTATLKAILRALPQALVQMDLEGRILFWNEAAERIFGWTSNEVIGRSLPFVPDERIEETRRIRECVFAGEPVAGLEVQRLCKDGSLLDVTVSSAPLRDRQGNVTGAISLFTDISGHKLVIQERGDLEQQLRQSQKLETVGRLAGGVAHDFSNLLQVILGYADMMMDVFPEENPLHEGVQGILKAGQRASLLIQQLLAFSRRQVSQPVVMNLNDVVRDMEKMLRRILGEDVQIRCELAADLKPILADPGQIGQVIMNLAVNARDAMPRGGMFHLCTEMLSRERIRALRHPEICPGEYALLSISDTGCGMSAQVKEHLFEPFYTTKAKGKGTGLGLATLYGIVKQSGGHVLVYSEEGEGTVFRIYLPVAAACSDPLEVCEEPPPLQGGQETILLAEDDEGVRQLTSQALDAFGYRVLEANNGEDALALSAAFGDEIHLLITDVVMPKMNGRDLAEALQKQRPEIRILYISGFTEDMLAGRGVMPSNIPFLSKPFAISDLARMVRSALDAVGAPVEET